jgi:hypothetical protein
MTSPKYSFVKQEIINILEEKFFTRSDEDTYIFSEVYIDEETQEEHEILQTVSFPKTIIPDRVLFEYDYFGAHEEYLISFEIYNSECLDIDSIFKYLMEKVHKKNI